MHEHNQHNQPERDHEELEAAARRVRRKTVWGTVALVLAAGLLTVPGGLDVLVLLGVVCIGVWAWRQWREIHHDDPAYERLFQREEREASARTWARAWRRESTHVLGTPREPWRSERWIGEQTRIGVTQIEQFLQTQR